MGGQKPAIGWPSILGVRHLYHEKILGREMAEKEKQNVSAQWREAELKTCRW